jgi:hypothetical protein
MPRYDIVFYDAHGHLVHEVDQAEMEEIQDAVDYVKTLLNTEIKHPVTVASINIEQVIDTEVEGEC